MAALAQVSQSRPKLLFIVGRVPCISLARIQAVRVVQVHYGLAPALPKPALLAVSRLR